MNPDSSYMFYKLKALKELDINMFDTTKVKSMEYMFAYTDSLETINLKRSNLSNVEDMSFMFYSG
jgi:surface protein